MSRKRRL